MTGKNVLGRGLDALIGPGAQESRRVLEVEIHRLHPNPRQPRVHFEAKALEELSHSIADSGLLQPILVRPRGADYEIVAGERRWRAAQLAGLTRVPVIVRDVADSQMLQLALVENLQRSDLGPMEEARAYHTLVEDLGLSQEEVARRVGRERATVANMMRLVHLPRRATEALEGGAITVGHAKAILSRKRGEEQDALLTAILHRGLSVREAEAWRAPEARARGKSKRKDPDTAEAELRLAKVLGMPVEIRRKGRGGELAVRFRTEEELQRLYDALHGESRRSR